MTTLSGSIPAQAGIADYLQHGGFDRHLRKVRGTLRTQLREMEASIQRWLPQGVRTANPTGGYFIWLEFPEAIDAMELHRLAIEQGISLAPGPIFSATHAFEHYVRLNFGHPWSPRIDDAIRVLGELLARPSVRAK